MKAIKHLSFANKFYTLLIFSYLAVLFHVRYLNTIHNLAYWGVYDHVISVFSTTVWTLVIFRLVFCFFKFLYHDSQEEEPKHKIMSTLTLLASPFIFIVFLYYFVFAFAMLEEPREEVIIYNENIYVALQESRLLHCELNLYEYVDSKFRVYSPSYSSSIKQSCFSESLSPFEDNPYALSPFFKKHDNFEQ